MHSELSGMVNKPPYLSDTPPQISSNSPIRASKQEPSLISIEYTVDGPLGLEFEDMNFPYKVEGVRANGVSAEKGVRKGDLLMSVNGKSTEGMVWDKIRVELSIRPATAVFKREPTTESVAASTMWNLGAGLIGGHTSPETERVRQERDELREIVSSLGLDDISRIRQVGEDFERSKTQLRELESSLETLQSEKQKSLSLLEEERSRSSKLVEVIEEIEKSQQAVVERFESEVQDRERQINELRDKINATEATVTPSLVPPEVSEALALAEAKLELIEKDNTRLRKENTELGSMVQKCLEKLQKDLSDKPHWVDRRMVTRAVANFLSELDSLDESKSDAMDVHLSARQKLGDVLGLTEEERLSMRLLAYPVRLGATIGEDKSPKNHSISEDFLQFLEKETNV